jgi:subtilase family protein
MPGMSGPRGLVAAAAVIGAVVAASPALAIDLSLRPPSLPPLDGAARTQALTLAASGNDLVVAVASDRRALPTLRVHGARRLAPGLWLVDGKHSRAVVRRLAATGVLRYAHPNGRLQESVAWAGQADPADPAPWWLRQIGADTLTPPGPGFPLTLVDDGIDTAHPEFAGRQLTYLNQHQLVEDEDYHGTMMGSIAAAPANGVGIVGLYPRASLRVADTGIGTCADVLAALNAVITRGASVMNMSWGFSPPQCLAMHDVLVRGLAKGILPVSASGNMRLHFSPPGVPAMWPHVLTVGSTGLAGLVSFFSSEGQGIDVAAPGEFIVAATPLWFDSTGYAELEGTSFSAALVSAAAAWLATRRPMHVTQLFELIRSSARDVGAPGWDKDTGYGILDLRAALTRALPPVDPLEPNDDVNQVTAGPLVAESAPGLTRPGVTRASVRARVDRSEDPVDVYRVFVPAKHGLRLRVVPTSNVHLELFRPSARSCYYGNRRRALLAGLIGGSYRGGNSPEAFAVQASSRSRYLYACIYKPRDRQLTASYSLSVATTGDAGATTNR